MSKKQTYDLVIVGAGVSGAAQYFAASLYTDIKNVLLVEKESDIGQINSAATQNSQTLHEGDIETNYNLEKATVVKHKSGFTRNYLERTKSHKLGDLFLKSPKMVLGVGEKEVEFLNERYKNFTDLFPTLEQLSSTEITHREPKIIEGRDEEESITALYNQDGVTVDYGKLAGELITDSQTEFDRIENRNGEVLLNTKVSNIKKVTEGYDLDINGETITTRYLSVCAGAHSMYFAKKMGLKDVKTQSLLLVAGNFYYTPKYLNAKVYTVQNPKLPFSAVHGDPDILNQEDKTRYGPTTRIVVNLERGRFGTFFEYLSTISPIFASIGAYIRIMFDKEFFFYAMKHNLLFLIPGVGNYLFAKEVRKIIPTLRSRDIYQAKGQGGVRPQIVQTSNSNPLSLGEAKIQTERAMFNVTPSPGASTCIFNGLTDVKRLAEELGETFHEYKMETDFGRPLTLNN